MACSAAAWILVWWTFDLCRLTSAASISIFQVLIWSMTGSLPAWDGGQSGRMDAHANAHLILRRSARWTKLIHTYTHAEKEREISGRGGRRSFWERASAAFLRIRARSGNQYAYIYCVPLCPSPRKSHSCSSHAWGSKWETKLID